MDENKQEKQLLKEPKKKLEQGRQGLMKVVFGRTGIILLLMLIQIGILLIGFKLIRDYLFAAYWATVFLGLWLVVVIIGKKGNPAFQIAWIVPILTVPVFGALFYLYFSTQLGTRQLNKRILDEAAGTASLIPQDPSILEELKEQSPQMANLAVYLRKASGSAVHKNTSAVYFACGEDLMEPLLKELRAAKKFIFLEYFIIHSGYMWDSVLEVLTEKAKEGVEVRLLYDGMNDLFRFPKEYPQQLGELGIKCRVFAPIVPALSTVQNNRDHRKILVIDGHTVFTGGINLADEYINRRERFGYWKDSATMFRGEAASNFTLMFLQMWKVSGNEKLPESYKNYIEPPQLAQEQQGSGFVIPFGDNPLDGEQVGELIYMDILYSARKYVHITTPYLVLDREMIVALTYAAKRGVDVKIIMPHIPDKKYAFLLARTYYEELLQAGVQIFEFTPGFLHTKSLVSDDEKAVVGSVNMDYRSFYLSFECGAVLYRNEAVSSIEHDYQQTLKRCVAVTQDLYRSQPLPQRIAGKVLRLFAPLM